MGHCPLLKVALTFICPINLDLHSAANGVDIVGILLIGFSIVGLVEMKGRIVVNYRDKGSRKAF